MVRKLQIMALLIVLFVLIASTDHYAIQMERIDINYSLKGFSYLGRIENPNNRSADIHFYINAKKIIILDENNPSEAYKTIALESSPLSSKFFTWQTRKNYAEYETNLLAVTNNNGQPKLECHVLDIKTLKLSLKWSTPLQHPCKIIAYKNWRKDFDYENEILLHSSDRKHAYILDFSGKFTSKHDYPKPVYVCFSFFTYDGNKLFDLNKNVYYQPEIPGIVDKTISSITFGQYGNMSIYNGKTIYSIAFNNKRLTKIIDMEDVLSLHSESSSLTYITTAKGFYLFNEITHKLTLVSNQKYQYQQDLYSHEESSGLYSSKFFLCPDNGTKPMISIRTRLWPDVIFMEYEIRKGNLIYSYTIGHSLFLATDLCFYKIDISFLEFYREFLYIGPNQDPFDFINDLFK